MVVKKLEDPVLFLETAHSLLLADEARNNLILGLAGTLRDYPRVYPEYDLWLVQAPARITAAALRTPPYNLVLAGPSSRAALDILADHLLAADTELPGVTGAVPEVERFSHAWIQRGELVARRRSNQRIYRLTELRPVEGVPGRARSATELDRPLLLEWMAAFGDEVTAEETPGRDAGRMVDQRLSEGAGGFTIWEDSEPVSVAGWGGTTPNGIRIGPVYTPPALRGRGYGSAVTAAVSSQHLASGRRFCFLYTDLSNPTSNKIYVALGYEPVCDSVDYAFDREHA